MPLTPDAASALRLGARLLVTDPGPSPVKFGMVVGLVVVLRGVDVGQIGVWLRVDAPDDVRRLHGMATVVLFPHEVDLWQP